MLDLEVTQRQEAEKQIEEQVSIAESLERDQSKLRAELKDKERSLNEQKAQVAKELEAERERLQAEVDQQH